MIQEANMHWRYHENEILLPWYTLPALKWLLSLPNLKTLRVFEYGAGYSTLWWKLNAASVTSVDHDPKWATAFDAKCLTGDDYVKAPFSSYDCIVVDGEHRLECVKHAKDLIKPGGFLIIDNFEFFGDEGKHEVVTLLADWRRQEYKQPNHSAWTTLVFEKLG